MAKKQEVEAVKENANAVAVLDFAADAGAGLEGADNGSFAVPFLAVLQGLSPALETVEGAKPGLLMNTVTNELMKEAIVIPCAFQRRYLRWDGAARGKYKGDLSPIDVETGKVVGATRDDKGQWNIGDDILKDTRNHYVLVKSASGSWQPALLSLGSTQIKKSKRWLSRIQGIELPGPNGKPYNPASYSHVYKVTTLKEENDQGSWFGVTIDVVGPVTDAELYAKAKAFNKQVTAGMVVVSEPPAAETSEAF